MSDNLFEAKLDVAVNDKQALYHLLSESVESTSYDKLIKLMEARETDGSIEIAEEVILPHIESSLLKESKVLIIRPQQKLTWSTEIKKVKLIIVIFLKENENDTKKKRISQFTRKLADEDYLKALMQDKTIEFN